MRICIESMAETLCKSGTDQDPDIHCKDPKHKSI